jgi:aminoglycoside phosphotransferase (APT) family kinase protein
MPAAGPDAGAWAAQRQALRRTFDRKADVEAPDAVLRALPAAKARVATDAAGALAREAQRVLQVGPLRAALLPDAGTFHAVFRLTAGSGPGWYARTSVPSLPAPALHFQIEAWAAPAARAAGLPVPAVRHVDLSRQHLPYDLEIVDAAPGIPLADATGLLPLAALGRAVRSLHAVAVDGFGLLDPGAWDAAGPPRGACDSWPEFLLTHLDAHVAACRRDGALTADEAADALACHRDAEAQLATQTGALLHGDLANRNVLVEDGALSAILDWEDALAGDPLFDVACWGTFVGNHERRAAFLAGYAGAATLPAEAEFRYWLYYLRIMLAKTVHRRRFGWAATDRIPAGARLRPALDALRRLARTS